MSNFDLVATLKANVSNFTSGMRDAQNAMQNLSDESKNMSQRIGGVMQNVGKAMTVAVTLPIIAGAAGSVKAFSDMETAMRGVSKTTELTETEFEAMQKAILNMSREMPVAATEIASVAEVAGQLGVEKDRLLDFTETMVMLGTSTNMSSEEAATALARLANITGMPQTEFDRLGSTVVDLGNNLATTEQEIVDMGLRLAGTGSQIGLTEHQIMALAGAMSSVGIQAEAGGTAMSTVMQKINTAVLSGSEEVGSFAKVAGVSAQEFAKTWESDPQTAILSFISGLGDLNEEGVDTVTLLDELGISGIREVDTLNRLSGASDILANSFNLANGAWHENTALTNEAQEAWGTMASQAQILWNAVKELGITIGAVLAPAISSIVGWATRIIQSFIDMDEGTQRIILGFVGAAAVAGPLLVAFGTMLVLLPRMVEGLKLMKIALLGTGESVGLLSKAFAFLKSPIGLVILAIIAIVGVIIYLWNTNEEFRAAVIDIWNRIKEGIQTAWEALRAYLQPAVQAVVDFVKEIFGGLVTWWQENNEMILQAAQNVWNFVSQVITVALGVIMAVMQKVWPFVEKLVVFTWNAIKDVIQGAITVITGIIEFFSALFTGNWSALWESVKQIVTGAVQLIWGLIKLWFVTKIIALAKALLVGLKTIVTTIWKTIKSIFTGGLQFIFGKVSSILGSILKVFTNIFGNVVKSVTSSFTKVTSAVSKGMSSALRTVTNFVSKFFKAGANIVGNIAKGITSAVGKVTSAIGGVLGKARDLLPFSPPKDKSSPMVDVHKNGIIEQIAKGIYGEENQLKKAMNSVLGTAGNEVSDFNGNINDALRSSINGGYSMNASGELSVKQQPAYLNLNIGGQNFTAFVDNISDAQNKKIRLESAFGL